MKKLNIITAEMAEKNIEMLGQMFPNCLTEKKNDEGKIVKAIDFDKLRQELADSVVEGPEERYQFTWPDKRNAIRLANAPTTKTLRPCREESVDFDNTQNLYIEGDNLDVLKILRENYLGKVKMIYIDPPYNTGNDFVYNDDFSQTSSEYIAESGQFDSDGNRLVLNTENNGRFHTDWLNMMYPRLKVAKDLLSDDGVIFISIDDNEVENLRKLCDEVLGEVNFVAQIVWQKIHSIKNDAKFFSDNHEYALLYARDKSNYQVQLLPRTESMNERYKNLDNDPRGPWQSGDLVASGERSAGHFIVTSPKTGKQFDVPQGKHWVYSEANLKAMLDDNRIWFGADGNSFPRKKRFLTEVQDGRTPSTIWLSEEVGHNQSATREVKLLFDDKKYFDFPKPVDYILQMLQVASVKDSLILDFFSGSATTAHAVMQLNAEDGGNRRFIMVQLPELTDEKSEAYKAGYKNLCEIGKERIRRAGKKVKEEAGLQGQNLDIGFRVLKLDSANEKEVKRTPSEVPVEQGLFDAMLDDMVENIKEDRTPEDLLFQVLPMCNLPLSCKIETKEIDSKCVFVVEDGYLVACFDENINEEVITAIAKMKPYYFIMRDSSLATDNVADNFDQIFNAYSKDTIRRIL